MQDLATCQESGKCSPTPGCSLYLACHGQSTQSKDTEGGGDASDAEILIVRRLSRFIKREDRCKTEKSGDHKGGISHRLGKRRENTSKET
ncbi:hypothetical protein shn_31600 (plasmid) [Shinella sp. HZN7]|nr:hypothetical protein shn_31600 [Shinella sp. HZN7]